VQHLQTKSGNMAAYPSDGSDSHPNSVGNQKATNEFAAFLNVNVNRWNRQADAGETVDFSANQTGGVAPLSVSFSAQCTGSVTGYLWNFGDGTSSTLMNPTHAYTAQGKYTVSLTATFADGAITATRADYVVVSAPVTLVSPNGSEIWGGAATQVIRWSYSGNPGPYVKIELMKAGVLNRVLTGKASIGAKGNGSYSWYIPCEQPSAGDYAIRVTSTANSACSVVSRNFAIKGAGIGVVAPVGGEQWKTNESRKLQWSYAGCAGSYVRIELLKNGVSSLTITSSAKMGASGNGTFTWKIPSGTKPGADYKIRITSTQYPGLSGVSNGNFTILEK